MKAEPKTRKARRSKYTEEFKAGALGLVAEGRTPTSVAHDLGLHPWSIYNWLKQAKVDAGKGPPPGVLTMDEKAELAARRKEVCVLKEERRLRVLCREAHEHSRGNYGSVRVHKALRRQGVFVSRKQVCRLMKLEGIAGKRRSEPPSSVVAHLVACCTTATRGARTPARPAKSSSMTTASCAA